MKTNTSVNSGSATIYQFPAGGRAAVNGCHRGETETTSEPNSIRAGEISWSSSWYHEEAIRESRPVDEH